MVKHKKISKVEHVKKKKKKDGKKRSRKHMLKK
jgi:hypothetical protein